MEIYQRCCGTTLRRRGIKLKLEQNENIFLKVIKHNRYLQNTLNIFIITLLSYKIAILVILLCMELSKTIASQMLTLHFTQKIRL